MKILHSIIAFAFVVQVQASTFAQAPSSQYESLVKLKVRSDDEGHHLSAVATYSNGEILPCFGHVHEDSAGGNVEVEHQIGNEWFPAGRWVIGGRGDRHVIAFDVNSADVGRTLNGTMSYATEAEIRVRAVRGNGVVYDVDHQFGGQSHEAGAWVLGSRVSVRTNDRAMRRAAAGSTRHASGMRNCSPPELYTENASQGSPLYETHSRLSSNHDRRKSPAFG